MDKPRGTCPDCKAEGILLTKDGTLWRHEPGSRKIKDKKELCSGWGKEPS